MELHYVGLYKQLIISYGQVFFTQISGLVARVDKYAGTTGQYNIMVVQFHLKKLLCIYHIVLSIPQRLLRTLNSSQNKN